MRTCGTVVLLLAVALWGAACGRPTPSDGTRPSPAGQTVTVVAREWAIEPAVLQAKAGPVTFQVRNEGAVEHNFVIENIPRSLAESIQPGQSKAVTATLTPGDYTVICNLPGHREAGMVATLKVSP